MRITRISTAALQSNFEWILLRVETDAGITGLGEAHWGAGVRETVLQLRELVLGEDPRDVDRLWRKMYRAITGAPWAGAVVCAANGIETALFDIIGKYYRIPIYQLLGGRYRDRVRVYADCHAGRRPPDEAPSGGAALVSWHNRYDPLADYDPEAYADRAREVVAQGFSALKFDLDVPTPLERDPHSGVLSREHLEYLVAVVRCVREAIGPSVDLALDCHWHFGVGDAIRLSRALEPFEPWWLEDPVPPENIDALAQVSAATRTPVCAGENLYLHEPFVRLLAKQAVAIVEPDFPRSGGFLEFKRICQIADSWYVPVAPHNVGSPVATLAAAHVSAAVPNFLALEFHGIDVPWWRDLVVGDAAAIQDGYLCVPDGPGLGVDLNEDVARAHLKPGTGFFED